MKRYQAVTFDNDCDIYQYNLECKISRGTLIEAHLADLHFNAFDPAEQYKILMEQPYEIMAQMPKLDIVSINGDTYDTKMLASSDGVRYAIMFIDKLVDLCRNKNATLIIVLGTSGHDANQLKLFYRYMEDPSVDVRIVTRIQFEYIKGAKILCIPELAGVDDNVYSHFLLYSGLYDSVFMHGTFEGSSYAPSANCKLFNINDFVNCTGPIISGHVHKPGCFNKYFYYCGSPYAWRFDDDHQKGFLIVAHNLDTGAHYCQFEPIRSFKYETIELDNIVNEDPRIVIDYINKLKQDNGIDYIKIRFNTLVPGASKTIISNYYRNNRNVFVEFLNPNKEAIKRMENEDGNELSEYNFISDPHISDENKLAMYINMQKGYEFISVEKLINLLEEDNI